MEYEVINKEELEKDDLIYVIEFLETFRNEKLQELANQIDYYEEDIKNREKFNQSVMGIVRRREELIHQREGFLIFSNQFEELLKSNEIVLESEAE